MIPSAGRIATRHLAAKPPPLDVPVPIFAESGGMDDYHRHDVVVRVLAPGDIRVVFPKTYEWGYYTGTRPTDEPPYEWDLERFMHGSVYTSMRRVENLAEVRKAVAKVLDTLQQKKDAVGKALVKARDPGVRLVPTAQTIAKAVKDGDVEKNRKASAALVLIIDEVLRYLGESGYTNMLKSSANWYLSGATPLPSTPAMAAVAAIAVARLAYAARDLHSDLKEYEGMGDRLSPAAQNLRFRMFGRVSNLLMALDSNGLSYDKHGFSVNQSLRNLLIDRSHRRK